MRRVIFLKFNFLIQTLLAFFILHSFLKKVELHFFPIKMQIYISTCILYFNILFFVNPFIFNDMNLFSPIKKKKKYDFFFREEKKYGCICNWSHAATLPIFISFFLLFLSVILYKLSPYLVTTTLD